MKEEAWTIIIVVPVIVFLINHDPMPWAKTEVGDCGEWRWLGDGRAPAGAYGPHVNVRANATSGG
jgi:hypothetical protein